MPKSDAATEIRDALGKALTLDYTPHVATGMENMVDPEEIIDESNRQLQAIKCISNSITMIAKFHQGRAIELSREKLKLSRRERIAVTNIYKIFKGYEHILPNYHYSIAPFYQLAGRDITGLRAYIAEAEFDKINIDLTELLEQGFEDEPFPSAEEDVTQSPEMLNFEALPALEQE